VPDGALLARAAAQLAEGFSSLHVVNNDYGLAGLLLPLAPHPSHARPAADFTITSATSPLQSGKTTPEPQAET